MIDEDVKAVRSCGNVFKDLGFDDEEAENLRIRTLLMLETEEYIRRQNITRNQVSRRFGMTSSHVGNLLSGKLDLFTIDMLVNILARAGIRLNIAVQREDVADPEINPGSENQSLGINSEAESSPAIVTIWQCASAYFRFQPGDLSLGDAS